MSGVEAAGFVLASLPLAISILEHYQETAAVLKTWWKIRTEYRKCVRDLKFHNDEFESNLLELLLPVIADDDKLEELLKDPGGPCWSDSSLEDALRERMPKRYESYLDTISMMKETVERLHVAMGMNMAELQKRVAGNFEPKASEKGVRTHVTDFGRETINWQLQRLKWSTLDKTSRAELFKDFEEYNGRLSQILGSSDRVGELSRARAPKSNSIDKRFWGFWNHGDVLYNLLLKAWSCGCRPYHHANLLLEHRAASTISFRVIFWFQAQLIEKRHPWTWQATKFELLEEPPIPAITSIKVSTPISSNGLGTKTGTNSGTPSSSLSRHASAPQLDTPFRPRDIFKFRTKTSKSILKSKNGVITGQTVVCEVENCPPVKTKVTFMAPGPPKEKDPTPEPPANPQITNLCEKIAGCSTELIQYGYLEGETNKFIVTPLCEANKDPQKHITLKSLLSTSSDIRLTRQERFQIALILTSSYIQLHPTPWLPSKWSKKDIFFFYDPDDSTKVRTSQPYISRALSDQLQEKKTFIAMNIPCTSTNEFRDSIHSLGIMLLELCFGKQIEDHPYWKRFNPTDEQSLQIVNHGVARDWCDKEVQGEAGPEYKSAVDWCLHHVPGSSAGAGEKQDQWREDMFVRVVEPVKKCHDHLAG